MREGTGESITAPRRRFSRACAWSALRSHVNTPYARIHGAVQRLAALSPSRPTRSFALDAVKEREGLVESMSNLWPPWRFRAWSRRLPTYPGPSPPRVVARLRKEEMRPVDGAFLAPRAPARASRLCRAVPASAEC